MGSESIFGIKDGNADSKFKNRVDSIFGCLDNLEKKHNDHCIENIPKDSNETAASTSSHRRSCYDESKKVEFNEFKKPFSPNKKRYSKKNTPDHVLNPSKWTKYSLKEDGTRELKKEGMTANQLNERVAIDFINDLRNRRGKNTEIPDNCEIKSDLTFKKPIKEEKSTSNSTLTCGSSHSGKSVIMKTYEVGQKENRSSKKVSNIAGIEKRSEKIETPSHSVHLSHVSSNDSIIENLNEKTNALSETDESRQLTTTFVNKKKKQRNIRKREVEDDED